MTDRLGTYLSSLNFRNPKVEGSSCQSLVQKKNDRDNEAKHPFCSQAYGNLSAAEKKQND